MTCADYSLQRQDELERKHAVHLINFDGESLVSCDITKADARSPCSFVICAGAIKVVLSL